MSASFSRPDAKGRSSSRLMPREKKLMALRAPFVGMPVEVMVSDAYRTLDIHSRRVLDALLVEHANHAGRANGRLIVTYDQLQKEYRLSRGKIAPAIRDLERRGLICRTADGYARDGKRLPSQYRLTFFPSLPDRMGWTDEWRHFVKQPSRETGGPKPVSATSGNRMLVPARGPAGGSDDA